MSDDDFWEDRQPVNPLDLIADATQETVLEVQGSKTAIEELSLKVEQMHMDMAEHMMRAHDHSRETHRLLASIRIALIVLCGVAIMNFMR